ncbi:unnamed protein product [Medioppia subpectinata]|uniref:Protein kinase domain-containing protein n=1 Tax=Medioppia subpectinata TaxID=1979941 RepID=A0A7R9KGH9_9ACAR|nr:unnamed protein product [Medioppia subpectinata]CAG2102935.1 unnamed protein product [Medioppia subpectinata]
MGTSKKQSNRSSSISQTQTTPVLMNMTSQYEDDSYESYKTFYEKNFQELSFIGKGGYGPVYKVEHKLDGDYYAIKIVDCLASYDESKRKAILNEVKSLAKVRSKYVVKYYNSWLGDSRLYIQMEYCPQSLRKVLTEKGLAFGRQSAETMNAYEYYISCEIFTELLNCVQYLHELKPQIIHRDLKPENVLIVYNLNVTNFNQGRFIKLGDFGLATVHDSKIHYRTSNKHSADVGDLRYQAPEVVHKKYGHKCDIYSMGKIGEEIFDLDLNSRQECSQVLSKSTEWSIDRLEIVSQGSDLSEPDKKELMTKMSTLTKLNLDFVVKYYHTWFENNYLYIQSDYYKQTLRSIIIDKAIAFGRQPNDSLSVFEYYISCEIFKQLLQCVQYLHESNPPIIHLNLKPENIFISPSVDNTCSIKLSDFCLPLDMSVDMGYNSQTSVGFTLKYKAHEVYMGLTIYQSDIYSLAIIGSELFGIDHEILSPISACQMIESEFETPILCIKHILVENMSKFDWKQRPECREVLAKYNEWSIDKTIINNHKEFNATRNKLKSNDNSLYYKLISCESVTDETTHNDYDNYKKCKSNYGRKDIQSMISSNNNWYNNVNFQKDYGFNDMTTASFYASQFIEIAKIGVGSFGSVFKVKHKLDDKIYAVKTVQFPDSNKDKQQSILQEVKSIAKINSTFVVKYNNSWIEDKQLYIQMEYCSQTLGSVLRDKQQVFGRESMETMNIYEYYICCEIFRELLECVRYIHELTPSIIHRDIKPDNIFILYNSKKNSFLKLGDFGLATEHKTQSQSHTLGMGTPHYMAPEHLYTNKYSFKVDIYSVGIIGLKLFEMNLMYGPGKS